jgi:hypothetical protein
VIATTLFNYLGPAVVCPCRCRAHLAVTAEHTLIDGSSYAAAWHCRYFSHDYQTGLLVHSRKSVAMMAAIIVSFCYTGFMYVNGTSTPKPQAA